jgi:hypothetical protein
MRLITGAEIAAVNGGWIPVVALGSLFAGALDWDYQKTMLNSVLLQASVELLGEMVHKEQGLFPALIYGSIGGLIQGALGYYLGDLFSRE